MTGDDLLVELLEIVGRPRWHRDALCVEHPDVTCFAERYQSIAPAKAICASCLVRAECLAYALEHGIREGVWGGTSEGERRALRRAARRANERPGPFATERSCNTTAPEGHAGSALPFL